MIIVTLVKKTTQNWECVFQDEKKTEEKFVDFSFRRENAQNVFSSLSPGRCRNSTKTKIRETRWCNWWRTCTRQETMKWSEPLQRLGRNLEKKWTPIRFNTKRREWCDSQHFGLIKKNKRIFLRFTLMLKKEKNSSWLFDLSFIGFRWFLFCFRFNRKEHFFFAKWPQLVTLVRKPT